MSKKLELKARHIVGGKVTWHDSFVMQVALENIAKGKPFSKVALWLGIAGKIQLAIESDEEFYARNETPNKSIEIELNNTECRKLWDELMKLKPEDFGKDFRTGQPASPNPGTLYLMLEDIGKQLEFEIDIDT